MGKKIERKNKKERVLSETQKKVRLILGVLLIVFVLYSVICLSVVGASLLSMVSQNKKARNVELGKQRYDEIVQSGVTAKVALYSEEEIAKNSDLSVCNLYYFPNKTGTKTKYIIVVPGGGYFECDVNKVAFPYAARANEAGYTAFVLGYRYGKYSSRYAPIEDLAKAVKYITDNCEALNVDPTDYMVVGYSAGGNLTGLFASEELGYKKYGLNKPGAVSLVYPWININAEVEITGNYWEDLFAAVASLMGNGYLLGSKRTEEEKQGICVQNHVNSDYPPVFMISGDSDFVVPHQYNAEVMEEALRTHNVKYQYNLYDGLNHGFGLGEGTCAENWVAESIAFWESALA